MDLPAERMRGEVVALNPKIEQPLIDGNSIYGFSSGGGLRVIRIETEDGKLVGYGEAPQVEEAVAHAALDYQLGHEDYSRQYSGEGARYPHYLTGTTEISSPLDGHLRWGHTLDVSYRDSQVEVTLSGLDDTPTVPEEVHEAVRSTGEPITWQERGITYSITASRFPNGEPCTSMEVVDNPNNLNPWMFRYSRTGQADTFEAAVAEAFEAPQVEVMQPRN